MGSSGATFTHTYKGPGTYTITHKALDATGQQAVRTCAVTLRNVAIRGRVLRPADPARGETTSQPLGSAKIEVREAVTQSIVNTVYTSGSGRFTAGSLKPGTYDLFVSSRLYAFSEPAASGIVPIADVGDITGSAAAE